MHGAATLRDLHRVLLLVAYPATREELLAAAVAHHLEVELIDLIRGLPQPRFPEADAVERAIMRGHRPA